jgi:hypothetical protein
MYLYIIEFKLLSLEANFILRLLNIIFNTSLHFFIVSILRPMFPCIQSIISVYNNMTASFLIIFQSFRFNLEPKTLKISTVYTCMISLV